MSLRSKHLKLIGVAGATALTVGALASPALAAGTATVNYTCTTPLTPATPSAVYTVASAPAKMAVGQPLATTATFTLDANTTGLAAGLGWVKFKGTITTKPTASKAGLNLKFPKTAVGNGPSGTTLAHAKGSTRAGAAVGNFTFKLGDLGKVSLTGYDATGTEVGTAVFPTAGTFGRCNNDAGTTPLMNGANAVKTKLVKDKTSTKEKASYSAKKNAASGKAIVKSRYGTKVSGKVKFTLKKGTHKVRTITHKLNKKGIATVVFKGVKKPGKYSITGKYTGSKTLKASGDKATFRVR